jgi:hypothetical protein
MCAEPSNPQKLILIRRRFFSATGQPGRHEYFILALTFASMTWTVA